MKNMHKKGIRFVEHVHVPAACYESKVQICNSDSTDCVLTIDIPILYVQIPRIRDK